jgi:ATP-dependent RNA helicase MRH4
LSSTGEPEYSWKNQEPPRTPLFAHESFGAYDCVDDGLDHETAGLGLSATESRSRSSSKDYTLDDIDLNDPTIEKFPSDRGSVIDTLRKIQSSLSEDLVQVEPAPVSPRDVGYLADDGRGSPGALNPEVLTASRRRENRLSSRSMASLGSIPEDPKAEIGGNSADQENPAKPRRAVFEGPDTSSPSEGDDAVEWSGKKVMLPREAV